jgi:uncharacterized membrane protein YbaN (DUF454 family)
LNPGPKPLSLLARVLLHCFAVLCLVLGLIGVVLPGMPTTVFILMAAWAAARSSPRLHAWLRNHRIFGPLLRNWENGRTVSRRAKWSATITMAACAVIVSFTAHRAVDGRAGHRVHGGGARMVVVASAATGAAAVMRRDAVLRRILS